MPVPGSRARARRGLHFTIVVGAAAVAGACSGVTEPRSDEARGIATLWWVMLAVSCVVAVAVLALLFYAVVRPKRPSRLDSPRAAMLFTLIAGGIIPAVILAAVFGYSLVVMRQAASSGQDELVVRITAEQFKYTVEYPAQNVQVEDQLHLPAGRNVRLELLSRDVVHSFWVPELNGKLDMFPQRLNVMRVRDLQTGNFTARCAEFCGLEHATMTMDVVVESPEAFAAWVARNAVAGPGQ